MYEQHELDQLMAKQAELAERVKKADPPLDWVDLLEIEAILDGAEASSVARRKARSQA